MNASSLLRPIAAASAVLVLGSATPALAATSSPANAGPDPSPGAASPAPDPYPAATTRAAVVPRPVYSAPVESAPRRRSATPVRHAVRAAHHTITKHRASTTKPASTPPARMRRPEPPAPSLGDRIFGAVRDAPRVPTGAALAVALLVLVSGLFLAGVAREAAR
jgi:hypothetical protein